MNDAGTALLSGSLANNGTAGIGFGNEDNGGLSGGQRATNLVISQYSPPGT